MNANLYNLIRALRGPVMTITIGTLFSLDHFADIPFVQTWPMLIIVGGVWKLIEFLVSRPPALPNQPPAA